MVYAIQFSLVTIYEARHFLGSKGLRKGYRIGFNRGDGSMLNSIATSKKHLKQVDCMIVAFILPSVKLF